MKQIAKAASVAIAFYLGAAASASAMVGAPSAQAIANPNELSASKQNFLDVVTGVPFKTASGYAFKLSQSEDGLVLEIAGTDGATTRMLFSFYDDRTGNVSDENRNTVGRFWITSREIYVRYRDGWSEALWSLPSGDLQMAQKKPDGGVRYTVWYSRDHLPSSNALAALPAVNKPDAKPTATSVIATAKTRSVAPLQSIDVRTSMIHIIDQPVVANPVVAGGAAMATAQSFSIPPQQSEAQPSQEANPSKCLSVESNGAHWGFRNSCAFDIQFAYCVASNADQLTSCKDGAVTGSVAPHGFGALTADRSIGDSADHDFRWIACDGGAGEVVPRMDRSDPPVGRCLRSNAS